jgi:hypothetical protein
MKKLEYYNAGAAHASSRRWEWWSFHLGISDLAVTLLAFEAMGYGRLITNSVCTSLELGLTVAAVVCGSHARRIGAYGPRAEIGVILAKILAIYQVMSCLYYFGSTPLGPR